MRPQPGRAPAKALELGRGREVDYAAAFALALSGDLPQSRALAEDLAREFPEDTSVQFMYLPTLRALFSLNAHDPAAAIQALQTASRYDLALGGVGFIGRFGGLYPIYVRGLAYLAARQPAEAAAEFQRILDHRSIVLVDPMDAHGAPAAGASARALGRHREGEERLRRSLDAVEETPTRTSRWSRKHGRNTHDYRKRPILYGSLAGSLQCMTAPASRALSASLSDLKRFRGLTQFRRTVAVRRP